MTALFDGILPQDRIDKVTENISKQERRQKVSNAIIKTLVDLVERAGSIEVVYRGKTYTLDAEDVPPGVLNQFKQYVTAKVRGIAAP